MPLSPTEAALLARRRPFLLFGGDPGQRGKAARDRRSPPQDRRGPGRGIGASGLNAGPAQGDSRSSSRNILLNNPELLMEAQTSLEAKMEKLQSRAHGGCHQGQRGRIFRPAAHPSSVTPMAT